MLNHSFIRVLVVDDHMGTRIGLASLIEAEQPRMRCIGSAGTAGEALTHARALQPHVILLDVNLAGDDGLALIPALHLASRCAVVVLTSLQDPNVAMFALRLGAHACLHKTAPAAELMAAIFAAVPASEGGVFSPAGGTNYLLGGGTTDHAPHRSAAYIENSVTESTRKRDR